MGETFFSDTLGKSSILGLQDRSFPLNYQSNGNPVSFLPGSFSKIFLWSPCFREKT